MMGICRYIHYNFHLAQNIKIQQIKKIQEINKKNHSFIINFYLQNTKDEEAWNCLIWYLRSSEITPVSGLNNLINFLPQFDYQNIYQCKQSLPFHIND